MLTRCLKKFGNVFLRFSFRPRAGFLKKMFVLESGSEITTESLTIFCSGFQVPISHLNFFQHTVDIRSDRTILSTSKNQIKIKNQEHALDPNLQLMAHVHRRIVVECLSTKVSHLTYTFFTYAITLSSKDFRELFPTFPSRFSMRRESLKGQISKYRAIIM